MQCQILWGFDNPIRCENTARDWMVVKLANGDSKTISICRSCQTKIYGRKYAAQHRMKSDGLPAPVSAVLSAG